MKEIVSYFYKWKGTPRYLPAYRNYCSKHKTKKSLQTEKNSIASDFDDSSESEAESIEVNGYMEWIYGMDIWNAVCAKATSLISGELAMCLKKVFCVWSAIFIG